MKKSIVKPQHAPWLSRVGRKGALSFFAFLAFGAPARAQDASTLFRQMRSAEKTVSYRARMVKTSRDERQVANVWREGVKRRVEWLEPKVRQGDVLVDDGSNVWLYHRAENTVTQTRSRERAPGPRTVGNDWKVTQATGDFVVRSGAQIYVLDGQTKALLQVQRPSSTWMIKNVRFGAVDDGQFRFRTPNGASVTRLEGTLYNSVNQAKTAAAWLQVPSVVPKGYQFESAVVGKAQAWLRYSNGVRRFSLFQEHGGQGQRAPEKVNGGWFWKGGGSRFVASGLPQDAVNGLARSLK